MDEKFTAFCGLCCADCIPSNSRFFQLVQDLEEMLSDLQFEEYAKLKAEKNPVFAEYPTFIRLMQEMESLKCPALKRLFRVLGMWRAAYLYQAQLSEAYTFQPRLQSGFNWQARPEELVFKT